MISIRKYPNSLAAQRAIERLRANGIPAVMLNQHIAEGLGLAGSRFTSIEVAVADKSMRDRASALLDELDSEHPEAPEDFDENVSAPDLSLLDEEKYAVTCPDCDAPLPLNADLLTCPRCRKPINVIELIIDRYGPEALIDCYQLSPEDIESLGSNDLSDAAAIFKRMNERMRSRYLCRMCRNDLTDQAARGRCAECGALYDKEDPTKR